MRENMVKQSKVSKIVILVIGTLVQIYFSFPWIRGEEHTYIGLTYLLTVFREDATKVITREFPLSLELGANQGAFVMQFTLVVGLLVISQILCLIATIGGMTGFRFKKCTVIPSVIGMGLMYITGNIVSAGDVVIGNLNILGGLTYYYPFLCIVAAGLLHLTIRILESWNEAAIFAQKEREAKKERKRRLRFPGHYSRLFYQLLWKDLKYRWKDMAFLFLSAFLTVLFLFLGIGIYQKFSISYGEDTAVLGLGLVEIIRDFLVATAFVGLFLVSSTLSFYQKRKLASAGVIKTLGIRSQALFLSGIGELFVCFLAACIAAWAAGSVLLFLICQGISKWIPDTEASGKAGISVYLGTLAGIIVIAMFAYGVAYEMRGSYRSTDTRSRVASWEPLPGKSAAAVAAGFTVLGVILLYFYQQRRMAESLILVCGILVCVVIVFKNMWGILFRRKQADMEEFLSRLTNQYRLRYRFRTITRYLSLLMAIHVFFLAVFSVKFISSFSSEKPEDLYPYDYVFLANSQDDLYFNRLKEECEAEIYSFPMVRATTLDNTEMPDSFNEIVIQQGQNIGISETTYRALKELAGESWEDLDLDDGGNKIHVVYQQDQSSRAKPLDWFQWTKKPYIHIGQGLMAHNIYTRRETYPPREIISEERGALIGAFRQGKYENLIVFSDAYFNSVKDSWKTTDFLTGESVSPDEAVQGETIHEWPTRLCLVNVPEEYRERAEKILTAFRKDHAFDEQFDPLVKSAYDSGEEMHQREMERQMEMIVNGTILLMLLAGGTLLIHMKIRMDMPEMRKDYHFLATFGMDKEERICLEKREISRYVWIPLALAGGVSVVLTGLIWKLRLYEMSDIVNYIKYGILVWGGYVILQILNMKWMQKSIVRELETNGYRREDEQRQRG